MDLRVSFMAACRYGLVKVLTPEYMPELLQ
jgi:hypothetical protein